MNLIKLCLAALIPLCSAAHMSALDVGSQFNLSGGYRNDNISAHNTITRASGTESVDHLRFDNINLGEVGFNFRFTMPECERCCDHPFLRNFYLDGYAYWGWSGKDDFERILTDESAAGDITASFISHGRQKARTQDFQIGLGYLLWNCDCWAFGLTGGYANNWQRINISQGKTSTDSGPFADDALYNGLVFKQRWQGPWMGAELFYQYCNWLVDVGYEYHFAHYHASFTIPNNPVAQASDFSDVRKGKQGYGNVAYINAHYQLCEHWDLGLGFTYKQFRSRHAHMEPADGPFAAGTKGSANAKWTSYSILADVGYTF